MAVRKGHPPKTKTGKPLPTVTIRSGRPNQPTEEAGTGSAFETVRSGATIPKNGLPRRIAGADLSELVTELSREKASARVDVMDDGGRQGLIVVDAGSVSASSFGDETGPKALLSMLALISGSFRVLFPEEAPTTEHARVRTSALETVDEEWDPPTVKDFKRR